MVAPKHFIKALSNTAFNGLSKGLGNFLIVTSALGWALSSAGQITGMLSNDKLTKEDKKFLIPQEIADAVVNIGSFLLITKSVSALTKMLASSGKITTKAIKELCEKKGFNAGKFFVYDEETKILKKTNIGKSILNRVSELKTNMKINKETGLTNNFIKNNVGKLDIKEGIENVNSKYNSAMKGIHNEMQSEIDYLNKFYDEKYYPIQEGMEVIGAVGGGIIASNIVTPLIRNAFAASKQKQYLKQEQLNKPAEIKEIKVTANSTNQVAQILPESNPVTAPKNPVNTVKNYSLLSRPSGNMKI